MKLYVVIPVHNRKESTRSCLQCLCRQTYPSMQTVVVDDGSTDGTREMLEQDFSEVVRLEGDGNLFWTGGTNMGIRHALEQGAELIVTLNNDVEVGPDYIQKLVDAHLECPDALIGSINLTQEEVPRLLYAGVESFNPWTAKYVKRGELLKTYKGEFDGLLPTYSLPGRGVLIPRNVFEAIGLYDFENFPHYAADLDFSLRAKDAGFRVLINLDNPVFSPYEPDKHGGDNQKLLQYMGTFFKFRSPNYIPAWTKVICRHSTHKWYAPVEICLEFIRRIAGYLKRTISV